MFKNNMTSLVLASLFVIDPALEITINLMRRKISTTGSRLKLYKNKGISVKLIRLGLKSYHVPIIGIFVPENGSHTHLPSNSTDTVIDITLGWSEAVNFERLLEIYSFLAIV
jgi:hypothetical protein